MLSLLAEYINVANLGLTGIARVESWDMRTVWRIAGSWRLSHEGRFGVVEVLASQPAILEELFVRDNEEV